MCHYWSMFCWHWLWRCFSKHKLCVHMVRSCNVDWIQGQITNPHCFFLLIMVWSIHVPISKKIMQICNAIWNQVKTLHGKLFDHHQKYWKLKLLMVQNIVYKCWSINQGNYLKVTRKYGFVWHLVMPSYKSQTIIHMI